jgi:hypothetical protein
MISKDIDLLVTLFKTEGPVELLRRLAFRFARIHTFAVMKLPLSGRLPEGQIPDGIDFREVDVHELRRLRAGRTDLPEYFFRDESEQSLDRCWVGLAGGQLGFITWISLQGSSGFVRVGPTEAELAFIYCLKELRGRRMTTNAVFVISRILQAEGRTALLAVPHSENSAIVKSFEACGFVRMGGIRRFGFFTWPKTPVDVSMVDAG